MVSFIIFVAMICFLFDYLNNRSETRKKDLQKLNDYDRLRSEFNEYKKQYNETTFEKLYGQRVFEIQERFNSSEEILKFKKQHDKAFFEDILEKRISKFKNNLYQKTDFPIDNLNLDNTRVVKAATEPLTIKNINISADVFSKNSGKTYTTTLTSCTCEDFQFRHKPCKHMYRLALDVGLLIDKSNDINTAYSVLLDKQNNFSESLKLKELELKESFNNKELELKAKGLELNSSLKRKELTLKAQNMHARNELNSRAMKLRKSFLAQETIQRNSKAEFQMFLNRSFAFIDITLKKLRESESAIKIKESELNQLQNLIDTQQQTFPWLAKVFADYHYVEDLKKANCLTTKKNPAFKAADEVREIASEKRILSEQLKLAEYQLNFYESLFPWLVDFKEVSIDEAKNYVNQCSDSAESPDSYEYMRNWLSPTEYSELSTSEKFQLALDRYKNRQKSNWEVGIEYERYIGYLYESKGYKVKYNGAIMGLSDMGRDIIASTKDEIVIIQCKRWAKNKEIHEKHIFQLYGTMVLYQLQHPNIKIKGAFYSSTKLSSVSCECASYLGIEIYENFVFSEYPLIKCNIGRTGEKIYHLPFDQQYDKIRIEPEKGEFFCSSIAEAEERGFRRAFRWKPTD